MFESGFQDRLNALGPSQLQNIVSGCAQTLGLSDPSRLVEVTKRLGLAIVEVVELQRIVKVMSKHYIKVELSIGCSYLF